MTLCALLLGVIEFKGDYMKTITESELEALGRTPMKTRISLKSGKKLVHLLTDDEILKYVKTGKVDVGQDAEWIEVVKE